VAEFVRLYFRLMETEPTTPRGRYRVSWTSQSAVKRVDIRDRETGRHTSGSHFASWDAAYQQALARMFLTPMT
jgi:hypothetical protein